MKNGRSIVKNECSSIRLTSKHTIMCLHKMRQEVVSDDFFMTSTMEVCPLKGVLIRKMNSLIIVNRNANALRCCYVEIEVIFG